MTTQALKNEISQMQAVVDNPNTAESIKKSIRPALAKAKEKLAEMEAAKETPKHKQPAKSGKKNISQKPAASKSASAKRSATKAVKQVHVTEGNIRDAERRAKSPGKRISKTGNVYYEYRSNRSDRQRKKFPYLETGGVVPPPPPDADDFARGGQVKQNDPQGDNYTKDADSARSAKPVGWRYTSAGAKRLGVKINAVPTKAHIEKYANKYFKKDGADHRFIYEESRKDKSDKVRGVPHLEEGGVIEVEPVETVQLPVYFGTGDNIEVFGYQTKYFENSAILTALFLQCQNNIEEESNEAIRHTKKGILVNAAELVDEILGMEYKAATLEKIIYREDFNYVIGKFSRLSVEMWRLGVYKTPNDFTMDEHLAVIAEHLYVPAADITDEEVIEVVVEEPTEVEERFEYGGEIKTRKWKIVEGRLYQYLPNSKVIKVTSKSNVEEGAVKDQDKVAIVQPGTLSDDESDQLAGKLGIPRVDVDKAIANGTRYKWESGKIVRKVKFADKVEAIENSLEGKPVPKKYQKEYGKKYTSKTAHKAAQRIAGAMENN